MSIASISYRSLKDAANEADDVAKKLDKYADAINNDVFNKLNKYSGNWTSNITTARSKMSTKISELRTEHSKYKSYAQNLRDLRTKCESVDKSVKSNVSKLTKDFKQANGIRDSKIENAISYFFTSCDNSTSFGRWLGDKQDEFSRETNYLKDSIKEWYNYNGGKELITGVLVGLLEVAIGVLVIVSAILTGGATIWAAIVLAASVIGGIIAVSNGVANILSEGKAYEATQNGDPATGRRRSEINSWQDYLRSSFKFYDSKYYDESETNESQAYRQYYREEGKMNEVWATTIDAINTACTVITFVNSAGNLIKNGYKWATGSTASVKDIKIKDVFTKKSFADFKLRSSEVMAAFKGNKWQAIKDFGGQIIKDFSRNFKSEFLNFKNLDGTWNFKGTLGSIKNMISIPKTILEDGFTLTNITSIAINDIFLPSATAFTVGSNDATIVIGPGGQLQFDFSDKISIKTITGAIANIGKNISNIGDLFTSDSVVGKDILKKLNTSCNIDISIPEIYIPNVNLAVLRGV